MISLALVLRDGTEIRTRAQLATGGGAIAVVEVGPQYGPDHVVLQTQDTSAVFRRLAAALLDAADQADALLAAAAVPA